MNWSFQWRKKSSLVPPQRGGRQSEPGGAVGWCLTVWQWCLLDVIQSTTRFNLSEEHHFLLFQFNRGRSGLCHRHREVSCFALDECDFYNSSLRSLHHLASNLSPCIYFLNMNPSLPHRSCLHCSLGHIPTTMSVVPACLMWRRRMFSITCNKRDGAWIRPHMEPGWCHFHPHELGAPNSTLPVIASSAGSVRGAVQFIVSSNILQSGSVDWCFLEHLAEWNHVLTCICPTEVHTHNGYAKKLN